jgi:hypothetical protein
LTRHEIIGGICLGSHDSHVKFSNSIIRQAFTGGKQLGNVDLWFAVIYLMVKNGLVPHLSDQIEFLREHMIYRLKNSTTYMCLSGLPTYPTYRVPLNIALWSILSASAITNEPKEEPVRLHLSYAKEILHLLCITKLFVVEEIENYINRLECLRYLLNRKKKGEKAEIENIVKALKYNFIQLSDGTFVFIDGIPTEQQNRLVKRKLPETFHLISQEDIIYIESICDTQKKESEIEYSMKTKSKNVVIGGNNWSYKEKMPYNKVDICENTCRPYYNVGDRERSLTIKRLKDEIKTLETENSLSLRIKTLKDEIKTLETKNSQYTWKMKATEVYGNIELLSMNKLFGNHICHIKKYPLKEEFLKYLSNYFSRKDRQEKKDTLPICIKQFLNELYDEYKDIMENVSVEDFIKRWKNSANIENRLKMEQN